jgi:holo-[acyl-carrier protein] synthase
MIIGIGIDLAEVERYRFGDAERERFARKVYTEEEMHYAMRKRHWAERLAGFFAAKEATRKAFGHAIPLHGKAAELIERRRVRAIHLTITHTATTAAAVVILEG